MYAIFEAKGKQWRAEPGATLKLPSLDARPGDELTFDEVLLAERDGEVLVGRPSLDRASVEVEVVRHGKGKKIVVFKRKRRKNYRRKYGHRERFTEVRVMEIDLEGARAAGPKKAKKAKKAAAVEAKPEPEAEAAVEIDATPAAEELAAEHGIALAELEGTGKDGRILKSDVESAVKALEAEEEAEEEAKDEAPEEAPEPEAEEIDITPAAAELAAEHGVDVTEIEGTGKDGRVLKSDVQKAIRAQEEE